MRRLVPVATNPPKVASLVVTDSDRAAIPTIFRGLSARNLRLSAAARAGNALGGAVEFPILFDNPWRLASHAETSLG